MMSDTRLSDLESITEVQCRDGIWNFDPYMHGMANGLLLALVTMKGQEPDFKEAPGEWLIDSEKHRYARSPVTSMDKSTDTHVHL
jgi:hypothetical protein